MKRTADLVVTRAIVWTDGRRVPGVDALAIEGGRVLAVGSARDLEPLVGPATALVDAAGCTVTPGLCDAHIHLVQWARSLREVDLTGSVDRMDAARRVAAFAASHPSDAVLVGRGWDANPWSEAPERAVLDAVVPGRPVLLHSRDFHALWVNSAALSACGIDRSTTDPPGGVIHRDAAGHPTGVLLEHAVALTSKLTQGGADTDRAAVVEAIARLHATGVTAVHDFEGPSAQRVLRACSGGDEPVLRVLMHLAHSALEPAIATGLESGTGDDTFRIGAVKLFADGTLGSRTAALLAPYEGSDQAGLELLSRDELRDLVARAFAAGLSIAVHAIGDRAARNALDAFETSARHIPALRLPPRIEHLQLVEPSDVTRMARLSVAASMQPQHCVSDIELARHHWGARCDHSYPWRSVLDAGVTLAFGSDAPVEPPLVSLGLAHAVTRRRPGGAPFVPAQCLTLDEALAAYTSGAARLAGSGSLGTLRPGAAADFVVWNADLHALEPAGLAAARPSCTAVGGRIVHRSDDAALPRAERMAAGGAR
jgi:predicted amidohydrolase YtcJ